MLGFGVLGGDSCINVVQNGISSVDRLSSGFALSWDFAHVPR